MAEFKFSCPGCGQHIQLDELWRGHQIQCPSCQAETTVPQAEAHAAHAAPAAYSVPGAHAAPAAAGPPAVPTSTRLAKASAPASAAPAPTQTRFTPQRVAGKASSGGRAPWVKWATIGGVVIALGAAAVFGIPYILDVQDKNNSKRKADAKNSGGGEMGHTMDLYNVLDATEPGGRGLGGMPRGHGPSQREVQMEFPVIPNRNNGPAAVPNLPIVPAVWTLNPLTNSIPEGRANGMLAGTNFLVETARIDPVGTALVLRLVQGAVTSPDREMLIYLHLKPGETLAGHTWTIAKDMAAGVPEVKKRWKTDPKYAPQLKTIPSGYALQLELGQATNATVSGKIFLALPDDEKSVVAGYFNAAIMPAATGTPMAAAPRPIPRNPANDPYQKHHRPQ